MAEYVYFILFVVMGLMFVGASRFKYISRIFFTLSFASLALLGEYTMRVHQIYMAGIVLLLGGTGLALFGIYHILLLWAINRNPKPVFVKSDR